MPKQFAFPRRFKSAASLLATLTRNNRELLAFLNTFTVRFDADASKVSLPGDLSVAGSITTDGWTAATLLNSWVNFDAAVHRTAAYLKTSDGTVHVKGMVKDGTSASAIVLTLPTALRPGLKFNKPGVSAAGAARLEVLPDGTLLMVTNGSTTWQTIECSFQI